MKGKNIMTKKITRTEQELAAIAETRSYCQYIRQLSQLAGALEAERELILAAQLPEEIKEHDLAANARRIGRTAVELARFDAQVDEVSKTNPIAALYIRKHYRYGVPASKCSATAGTRQVQQAIADGLTLINPTPDYRKI